MRQVGSSFKPYSTRRHRWCASPDDTILDEPVSFETPSGPYSPHNYDENSKASYPPPCAGPVAQHSGAETREQSRIKSVIDYAGRFGSPRNCRLPARGAGSAEITIDGATSAYSVFPNDGSA